MALNNLTRIGNSGFGTDTSINTTGIVTAASFSGDGSALTGITAVGSGVVVQEEGSNVGTAQTINFIGTGVTATFSGGIASIEIATSGGGGGGLSDIVSDTTPQLGGNLDLNSKNITGTGVTITPGGNAAFSGIVTAFDLDVDGHTNLDNVDVVGVSTFDDVVNIKSALYLNGPGNQSDLYIGSSNQVKLDHNGGSAMWSNTVGLSYISTKGGVVVRKEGGGYDNIIRGIADGAVELYNDNYKKFETTSTGAIVTGTLVATATTATNVTVANEASDTECFVMFGVNATGNNAPKSSSSLKYNSSSGGLTAGSFIGDGSGLTGITASGSGVIVRDDGSLVGTAGTIDFGSNVSVSPISAGVVTVTASAGSIPGINTSLTTQLTNLTVAGVSTFQGNVNLNANLDLQDDDKILLGSGDDLEIYHTGSHSFIVDSGVGSLYIRASAGNIQDQGNANQSWLQFNSGAGVEAHFAGNKKFETTNAGITVTGTASATTFSGSGASLTTLNASELDSGTIPDARFPATLPAASGANLTNLPAANITGTLPAISGANLTNLPSPTPADTDVQVTYDVSSNGSSGYRFTGPGYSGADDNPDIYLVRGQRYRFINGTGSGHPFRIQSDTSGTAYTDGVSGSQSGTQDFNVQHDAPVRLYYQCTIHSGMIGNIYIVGASDWRMTDVATNATPEIFTNRNVGIGTDNPLSRLHVSGTHNSHIRMTNTADDAIDLIADANRAGQSNTILAIKARWNGTEVSKILFQTDADTTDKDDSNILFQTKESGSSIAERLRITSTGSVGIGLTNPTAKLEVATSVDGEATLATFKNTSGGGTNETVDIKLGLENTVASNVILRAGKEGNHSSSTATDNFFAIHTTLDNTSAEKLRITSAGQLNLAGNMQFTAATPEIELNNGGPRFRVPSANTLTIHTGGGLGATSNEKLRIQSGGGISFNGDTAAANALDDYEEGTWTPIFDTSISGGTLSGLSYNLQQGKYRKIGSMVYIEGVLRTTAVTNGGNGTYDISGLPFTASVDGTNGTFFCYSQHSWTNAPHHFGVVANTDHARARGGISVGDATYTNGAVNDFNTTSGSKNRVYFSGWYTTV